MVGVPRSLAFALTPTSLSRASAVRAAADGSEVISSSATAAARFT